MRSAKGARSDASSCASSARQTKPERTERFNRTYQEEVLRVFLLNTLSEVREITDGWLERYNETKPHDAPGNLPQARYREQLLSEEAPL